MFKFTAHNPESALSVLAAGFRLYFASFFYSLALALVSSLTFLTANYFFTSTIDLTQEYYAVLPWAIASALGLIFFIPLIKRIYSVGANLPITTAEAFHGFIRHFIRLFIFICLGTLVALIVPAMWQTLQPNIHNTSIVVLFFLIIFVYLYIGLKVYFTSLFIVLENKSIWEALKSSLRIEHYHMWLTFWVLAIYFFGYRVVISFTAGYFIWQPLGVDIYTLVLTTITLPLFLSIQICQFFNLKKMTKV